MPPRLTDSPRHNGEGAGLPNPLQRGPCIGTELAWGATYGGLECEVMGFPFALQLSFGEASLDHVSLSSEWHRLGLPNSNVAGTRASPSTEELVTAQRMNVCSAGCPRECGSGAARRWGFSGEVRNPNFHMELRQRLLSW